jgi:hypothetical protein
MNKLFLLLLLVGCGPDHKYELFPPRIEPTPRSYAPPYNPPQAAELTLYAQFFDAMYGTESEFTIELSFEETRTESHPKAIGWCFINSKRKITINPEFWANAREFEKEALMFHELGHCALNRPHTDAKMYDPQFGELPGSLMAPFIINNEAAYVKYRDYYLNELGQ